MKKIDVEAELKTLRAPERGDDYWEAFPDRVLAQLPVTQPKAAAPRSLPLALWCGGQWALACLMFIFCLWESQLPRTLSRALRANQQQWQSSVRHLDNNLGRLMRDEYGLGKLKLDQL